jgi:hypothetical protein
MVTVGRDVLYPLVRRVVHGRRKAVPLAASLGPHTQARSGRGSGVVGAAAQVAEPRRWNINYNPRSLVFHSKETTLLVPNTREGLR